jgi:phthiodiolone/phenolphthiodiolone dimycocerosates ketoreductase
MKISFGAYTLLTEGIPERVKHAILLEKYGFDSVWVGDHLIEVYCDIKAYDVWCTLTAIALNTERIKLGTCATDPHRKHPAVLVQSVNTVDQVSGGRVLLGIGGGEAMNLDPFGIGWHSPITRLEEAIQVMKQLWTRPLANHRGRFYDLRDAHVQVESAQKPHPAIYLAAGSPRSRRLVGRVANGWIGLGMTPDLYRKDMVDVEAGAIESGRDPRSIDVACVLHMAISNDAEAARSAVLDSARALLLSFPNQLERLGYACTREFDWLKLLVKQDTENRIKDHLGEVPADAAEQISIFGTPDQCIDRIGEFTKAGVTHFIFAIHPLNGSYKLLGEKVIPYFHEQ